MQEDPPSRPHWGASPSAIALTLVPTPHVRYARAITQRLCVTFTIGKCDRLSRRKLASWAHALNLTVHASKIRTFSRTATLCRSLRITPQIFFHLAIDSMAATPGDGDAVGTGRAIATTCKGKWQCELPSHRQPRKFSTVCKFLPTLAPRIPSSGARSVRQRVLNTLPRARRTNRVRMQMNCQSAMCLV